MTKRKASRRRDKSRPVLDDEEPLRLAALQRLLCALDPIAPPPDEYTAAVLAALDPVEVDGRIYIGVGKLREILEAAVAEARSLLPEQDPEVEEAIDEGFDRIAERGDKINPFAKPPAVLGRLKAVERILE